MNDVDYAEICLKSILQLQQFDLKHSIIQAYLFCCIYLNFFMSQLSQYFAQNQFCCLVEYLPSSLSSASKIRLARLMFLYV